MVAASTLLVALAVLLAAFGWGLRDLNRRLAAVEDRDNRLRARERAEVEADAERYQ